MPRVDCVALDLGAQRNASTLPRPNLLAPCLSPRTLVVPRYEIREKCGLVANVKAGAKNAWEICLKIPGQL